MFIKQEALRKDIKKYARGADFHYYFCILLVRALCMYEYISDII